MPARRSSARMFSRKFSGIDCASAICSALTGPAPRAPRARRRRGLRNRPLRWCARAHYPRRHGRLPAHRRLSLRRRPLRDRPSRSLSAGYCHCTRCQRRTGTAASAQARLAPGSFRITQGEELVKECAAARRIPQVLLLELRRSALEHGPRHRQIVMSVRLGTLDPGHDIRPTFRAVRRLRRRLGADPGRRPRALPREPRPLASDGTSRVPVALNVA